MKNPVAKGLRAKGGEKYKSPSFFEIDSNRLDEEWMRQPKLFFHYALALADARRRVEEQKAELDVITSEIDKDIRKNPGSFDLPDKYTETAIKNTIILQKRYKETSDELIEARYEVDILQAAVTAMEHRKSALEKLVSLHGQNYFSTPKASDEYGKKEAEAIEKRLSRRKRKKSEG